jgi:hypothetical protein
MTPPRESAASQPAQPPAEDFGAWFAGLPVERQRELDELADEARRFDGDVAAVEAATAKR